MRHKIKYFVFALLSLVYCLGHAAKDQYILLQSTTSTKNSGLYEYLLPKFEQEVGIGVRVVAVGTGQALKNARNGDADVLIVHAKYSEQEFVAQGYGIERFDLMYNDFVIVGPNNDPAGIEHISSVTEALTNLAKQKALFASRGDDSGTHKKEISLWKMANIDVSQASTNWYRETGSGMGATLNTAIAMQAYTITDRATWISFGNKQNYKILVEGDTALFNQYGVIIVSPEKHPHVKHKLAQRFVDWLLGEKGQILISNYRINGQQLFFPNADK